MAFVFTIRSVHAFGLRRRPTRRTGRASRL